MLHVLSQNPVAQGGGHFGRAVSEVGQRTLEWGGFLGWH
jgi:hypothetical protein